MIEHLTGTIISKDADHLIIEAGGVGYGLDVTSETIEAVGSVGSETSLWVMTYVREDALNLYGFRSRNEREAFGIFLEISGVGPKLGMAILSHFSIEQIVQIIMKGDAEALKKVPGVGLKKAEKLLIELKGRVKRLSAGIEPARLTALGAASVSAGASANFPTSAAREAAAALEALDLPPNIAQRAIAKALEILGPAAKTEDLVREGLRHRHG